MNITFLIQSTVHQFKRPFSLISKSLAIPPALFKALSELRMLIKRFFGNVLERVGGEQS